MGSRGAYAALERLALALALVWLLTTAAAATVTVDGASDPDSRLELRTVLLPDGSERELYVLEGDPIVVVIDGRQRLEGRLIEFDPSAREVRVIGPGVIEIDGERFEGSDLVIGLRDERVSGRDVLIVTTEVDVWGDVATRLPGQVDALSGLFSPCARCDQDPWDYGFRAERLRVYPGDRLVAEAVTVLVRDARVLTLPLLVLPLADADRQPRLRIESGDAERRAEVELSWPYVAGRDGLGRFTVRYLAEVDPRTGGWFWERFLGGSVVASHVAWELEHRHYDERGAGDLRIGYVPALPDLTSDAVDPAELRARASYRTDASVGAPSVRLALERNDALAPGRWEYDLGLVGEAEGVRGRFDTRGFIDTDAELRRTIAPTFAVRGEARQVFTRLRFEPLDPTRIVLGPVRLVAGELDLGLFEDVSDPTNRRVAARRFAQAGRARVVHTLQLEPLRPWAGVQFDARNAFDGRYYDSGERLVVWRTNLSVRQAFGRAGDVTFTFDRDVNEGETPFRFDSVTRRNRSELGVRLRLAPDPFWSLDHRSGYVLLDTRRPEDEGWQPLDTSLRLFGTVPAFDLSLRHRYGPEEGIPHTLEANADLRARQQPAELTFGVRHLQDLAPETEGGVTVSDTRTTVTWSAGVERAVQLQAQTSYRPQPEPAADGSLRFWSPLDLRLELGALRTGDTRPGVRAELRVDVDEGTLERLALTARSTLWQAELEATQRIDLQTGAVSDARLTLTLPERFSVVLRGVTWLPPAWLGVEVEEERAWPVVFTVRDTPADRRGRWELAVRTTFDPRLADGEGGRRDTILDVRVDLVREFLGPFDVSLQGFGEWRLRDDALDRTHLRRASLTLGVEAFERVGVQGSMSYVGTYSPVREELTRSELQLDRVTLSLRASDQLTLGAQVTDVWDFTRTRPDQSPWNLRPELFVVWDRCCWALAAAYDTGSGDLRLVLTGPGATTGIEEILPTPFGLERRPLPEGEATP